MDNIRAGAGIALLDNGLRRASYYVQRVASFFTELPWRVSL